MTAGISLVIVKGSEVGKKFSFEQETVNLGRDAIQNDVILNDVSVSGAHARITHEGEKCFLQDLGSTNKTYHKGGPLAEGEKVQLQDGDEFSLGKVVIRFQVQKDQKVESGTEKLIPETQDIKPHRKKKESDDGIVSLLRQKPVLAVGIAVVLLLVFLSLIKMFSSPAKTAKSVESQRFPDNSLQPIQLPAPGVYGNCKPDRTHPDKVILSFIGESGSAELHYIVGGIDSDGEVVILLNGTKLANAPLAMKGWSSEQSLHLPRDLITVGGTNKLVFDNVMNPPGREQWGVKGLRIEFLATDTCDNAEAKRLTDLGNQMYQEKAVSQGNIYRALKYYTEAVSKIEGCTPQPVILAELEGKLQTVRKELESRYNDLVFSYKKSVKLKNYNQAKGDLERIINLIPDEDDERHREALRLLNKISDYLNRRKK